jgi:hypothetical protein
MVSLFLAGTDNSTLGLPLLYPFASVLSPTPQLPLLSSGAGEATERFRLARLVGITRCFFGTITIGPQMQNRRWARRPLQLLVPENNNNNAALDLLASACCRGRTQSGNRTRTSQ